jgi:hypothetical protein
VVCDESQNSRRIYVVSVSQKVQEPICAKDELKSQLKNDQVAKLTGPYLSTGMELDQSEDIILTTISTLINEISLVAIAHKFVD